MPSAQPSAAIAVSAFITACVLPLAAQAQIVHFAPPTPIRVGPGESFDIDLDSSGTVDFTLSMSTVFSVPWGNRFSSKLSGTESSWAVYGSSWRSSWGLYTGLAAAMPSGTLIDNSLNWDGGWVWWALTLEIRDVGMRARREEVGGNWASVDQAIAGLRFLGSDGLQRFGWLNARSLGPVGVEILAWGYESSPDTPILAGAIPAPGAAGLLALGGLVAARRRR